MKYKLTIFNNDNTKKEIVFIDHSMFITKISDKIKTEYPSIEFFLEYYNEPDIKFLDDVLEELQKKQLVAW